jgi:hypothetical protein
MNKYQCCASCVNYEIKKEDGKTVYLCSRLGFITKPTYKFDCWEPNDTVKRLMAAHSK